MVACRLYRDALAPSTKITYKTGVRHLMRFRLKYPKAPLPPNDFTAPSQASISLVFFAAYLFELDSIKAFGTIRNYMSQVRQFYVKRGYPKKRLNSPLLKAVMQGIKRCTPPEADSRVAFLLIHYPIPRQFIKSRSGTLKKTLAAISFGFFAMLRFHSYGQFCLENLTLVLKEGREISPTTFGREIILKVLGSNCLAGFYFTFDDKFHPGARAYYCKVGDIHHNLERICPIKHLTDVVKISQNDMFFPKTEISSELLTKHMRTMACIKKMLNRTRYA